MLITQDKMEKPLMVSSRFRLVSSSSPVLLVLKCLPFFKMADDESKINTSLSFLLTTSCSFLAFKNNSARTDVWTLIEGIEMIFSFQFKLQLLFPQMRLVHKLLYHISKLVRALWLVILAGRTLLHVPLKFKDCFVPKLLRDLSPNFLNLWSK